MDISLVKFYVEEVEERNRRFECGFYYCALKFYLFEFIGFKVVDCLELFVNFFYLF